jgi:hypothetical protein
MLDRDVLEKNFFSTEDMEEPSSPPRAMRAKDQNTASMQPPAEKPHKEAEKLSETAQDTPQAKAKTTRRAPENKQAQTPARSRLIPDDKENETPSSTSSRKSKDAATARLHEIAPDIALYEKEMKRVGGVIYGGRRKSDEDRVSNNAKKRRSAEPQDESDGEQASDAKRQKKSRPPISMHLMITGYQKWVGKGNEKKEDADKVCDHYLFTSICEC